MRTKNTDELRAEFADTLLRNFALVEKTGRAPFEAVSADDVRAMLIACANNMAQAYAGRVLKEAI